jgi:hypothetical protein
MPGVETPTGAVVVGAPGYAIAGDLTGMPG